MGKDLVRDTQQGCGKCHWNPGLLLADVITHVQHSSLGKAWVWCAISQEVQGRSLASGEADIGIQVVTLLSLLRLSKDLRSVLPGALRGRVHNGSAKWISMRKLGCGFSFHLF